MKRIVSILLVAALFLTLCMTSAFAAVEIEVFTRKQEIVDLFDDILNDYNASQQEATVVQNQVPDAATVLYSRMASNDVPDVVGVFPNESDFRLQAEAGYYKDLTGAAFLENVDKHFLDTVAIDDKYYSVPMTLNGWGILYNQAKFDELGLTVPTTWDELETLCAKIEELGYIPFATSLMEGWTVGHLAETIFINLAGAEAAKEFFADPAVKAEDMPLFQEMITWLDFFKANSQPDAISASYSSALTIFGSGQALMLPQGIWALAAVEQTGMTDQLAMFPVPNAEGKGMILYGVDLAFAVAADSENPDEIIDFMAYLTSTEVAQKLYDGEASPSTINGVDESKPEIEGVTNLLFEDGRNEPWLHFQWAAGVDGDWQAELTSYLVLEDKAEFNANINEVFGK